MTFNIPESAIDELHLRVKQINRDIERSTEDLDAAEEKAKYAQRAIAAAEIKRAQYEAIIAAVTTNL